MKKYVFLFLLLSLSTTVVANASDSKKFTISAQIDGLKVGDTLVFNTVSLPGYDLTPCFKVVVKKEGRFSYQGTHDHAENYVMVYKPCTDSLSKKEYWGSDLYITEGKFRIEGKVDAIDYVSIRGGLYDDPLLHQVRSLADSLTYESELLFQQAEAEKNDSLRNVMEDRAYDFATNHKAAYARVDSLEQLYMNRAPATELVAYKLYLNALSSDIEALEKGYSKLEGSIQQGYYGKKLSGIIQTLEGLEVGKPAPDFTLCDSVGNKASLQDFRGRHLLIYTWGLCGGSVMIDEYVLDLFNECDKDKFAVIGVSSHRKEIAERIKNEATERDMIKWVKITNYFRLMMAHPYPDYDLTLPENKSFKSAYMLAGLPYFIHIAPDGTILGRGYDEVYNQAVGVFTPEE